MSTDDLTRPGAPAFAMTDDSPDPAVVRRIARAEAALLGALAGDALGWRAETSGVPTGHGGGAATFSAWRITGSTEEVDAGGTSDDSQLTLAIARARVHGGLEGGSDWWPVWTETELPLWGLYERGGGRATRAAASSWALERAPWDADDHGAVKAYFHGGGNGVAIRALPHVIAHLTGATPEALMRDVFLDGVTTHGHPRALVGAQVQAIAGFLLAQGQIGPSADALIDAVLAYFPWHPPRALPVWWAAADQAMGWSHEAQWQDAAAEMKQLLEAVRRGIAEGMTADAVVDELGARGPMGGAGTVSVAAALHLVSRWRGDPVGAVLFAAECRGTDADSIASMTGGLLGLTHGRDWQPPGWLEVQDGALALALARKLATGVTGPTPRPVREVDLTRMRAALAGGQTTLELDGLRTATVLELRDERYHDTAFRHWILETSDGQRLHVRV